MIINCEKFYKEWIVQKKKNTIMKGPSEELIKLSLKGCEEARQQV